MKPLFIGLSDQGLLRTTNQDAYFIDESEGRFFIVADGMGGHAGGQEASRMATEAISDYLTEYWNAELSAPELLQEALLKANQAIVADQEQHPERADMGTTVVTVIFPPGEAKPWCAHVGDSRLYRLRGSELTQITEDHTWIAHAVKTGSLLPEQARNHPWRHVLAQCLGREEIENIDVQEIDVQSGDRLLICSDGLTEELTDALISIYLEEENPEKAAIGLVEAAKDKGGRDNITVVIITIP